MHRHQKNREYGFIYKTVHRIRTKIGNAQKQKTPLEY